MLDLQRIRMNPEEAAQALKYRLKNAADIDELLAAGERLRGLQQELADRQQKRNALAGQIARLGDSEAAPLKEEARRLNDEIRGLQSQLEPVDGEVRERVLALPNLPHASVPEGADASANVEVRQWGEPSLPVANPRPHWEVGPALGLDVERGTRMAGSRFYVLRGDLAQLELALIRLMMDQHVQQHGYEPVIPPFLVGREAMVGCGQLPKFADGLYHCSTDDLYLVPTAESALASLHAGEILPPDELPRKYVGYTPCFRREAGAGGQDNRGILRVHQFNKVELFQFTEPERSYEALEALVRDAEAVLQELGLPYRVVLLSAGDMGFAAAKTFDLEVWLPGQACYREISSCSNVEDFQARRTNTRFRPGPGAKPQFVHMLNGSGLAVGRTMVALLENCQRPDGSVVVPPALREYMGGREVLTPADRPGGSRS